MIGQDPSVSTKFNWLHVVIFRIFFMNLRYIPRISLNLWVIFLKVLNFNLLRLKLDQFSL